MSTKIVELRAEDTDGWVYTWAAGPDLDFGHLHWIREDDEENKGCAFGTMRPRTNAALVWKGRWYRLRREQGADFDPLAYRAQYGGPNDSERGG